MYLQWLITLYSLQCLYMFFDFHFNSFHLLIKCYAEEHAWIFLLNYEILVAVIWNPVFIFLNPRKRLSEGRSQLRDWISRYWLRIIEVNLFPISSSLIFIKYSVNFIKIFMLIVSFTVTTWQVLWLKLNWFIYQPPSWDSIS